MHWSRRVGLLVAVCFAGAVACGGVVAADREDAGSGAGTAGSGGDAFSEGGARRDGGAPGDGSGGVAPGDGGVPEGDGAAKPNSGDCADDADCPGGKCVALVRNGFRVCRFPVEAATHCTSSADTCCTSADCATGRCTVGPPIPPTCYGGSGNVCASDECSPGLCPPSSSGWTSVCMPAGAYQYQVSRCIPEYCLHDSDCSAEAGGICAIVTDPYSEGPGGLACVYPGNGCRTDADCPYGYCEIDPDPAHGGEMTGQCNDAIVCQ